MKHWPIKKLGEIAQVTAGDPAPQRPEDFSGNGTPFVRMQDVGRFGQTTCLVETKDRLSPSASTRLKRFPAGSILVPKSGASIRLNHRAILGIEAHVVSHLAVIVPLSTLNTRFVYYWLCGIDLSGVAHYADLPSMKTSDLAKLEIPVPPLAEQERIVKLLDEADELRKLRAQADRRTADLIPALFHEIFDNHGDFPTTTVADISEQRDGSIRTGPFGSDLRHSEFVEEGIPVLGIDNVVENEFRWTKSRCLTPAKFEEMRRFVVFPGDVLVTIMGTVGRSVVAPADLPVCISTKHLCTVTVNRKRVEPRYLWALFLFDESVRRQTRTVGKGAIMEGWNSTIIKRLIIRIPPLPLQKEFAQRVVEIREMEAEQVVSCSRLDALFQSLLHRAFEGEL